jgi:hypothetical protein
MVGGWVRIASRTVLPFALLVLAGALFLSVSCSSSEGESASPLDTERPATEDLNTAPVYTPEPSHEDANTAPLHTEGPRISFDEDSVYLGEATPEQEIHYEFHFQNIGDAPLVVHSARANTLEGC